MKSIMLCAAVLSMVGCITATISEPDACDTKSMSFDLSQAMSSVQSHLPSGETISSLCASAGTNNTLTFQLPPLSTTTDFDFSDVLKKVTDVASSVSVSVNQLMLDNAQGQLDFVSHAEVDVSGNGLPMAVLATYDASKVMSKELNVKVEMDAATMLTYLKSGPLTLTITMDSNPVFLAEVCSLAGMPNLSSSVNLCIAASGSFSK